MTVEVDDDRLRRILAYDPLGEADSTAMAFLNVQMSAAIKRDVLSGRGDTFWACPLDYFLQIARDEGFEVIDERPDEGDEFFPRYVERFLWQPRDAVLLHLTSYVRPGKTEPEIDDASMVFNCLLPFGTWTETRGAPGSQKPVELPSGEARACRYTLDGREGMRFKLGILREHGAFANPWVCAPSRAPLTYSREWRRVRRENADGSASLLLERGPTIAASRERLLRMPENVQRCLAVCHEEKTR